MMFFSWKNKPIWQKKMASILPKCFFTNEDQHYFDSLTSVVVSTNENKNIYTSVTHLKTLGGQNQKLFQINLLQYLYKTYCFCRVE